MIQALDVYRVRWNAWRSASINRRIFAASLTVAALSSVVHVCGAVKDLVVAYYFGTSDAFDAFLIAFLLPSFLVSVVAGSFPPAFIPAYMEVQHKKGQEAAEHLYSDVMGWSLVALIGTSLLIAALTPIVLPILGSGFSETKLHLTHTLFLILLPLLVLKGVTALWTMKLNAGDQFGFASAIPILTPIIAIVSLVYGSGNWGIYALATGTVVGACAETVIMGWYLKSIGENLVPRWFRCGPDLTQVIKQYGPGVAGAMLMAGTMLVDQAMAAMLGPGSVSALSYGGKVVSFAVAVGATALGTAVLPHFSRMVAAADWIAVRHTLHTHVSLILKISVPVTLIAVVLSESIVRALFQRGAFTVIDTHLVAQVQAFLLLQVPLYLVGIVIVRLISALKASYILMWGCVLNIRKKYRYTI